MKHNCEECVFYIYSYDKDCSYFCHNGMADNPNKLPNNYVLHSSFTNECGGYLHR